MITYRSGLPVISGQADGGEDYHNGLTKGAGMSDGFIEIDFQVIDGSGYSDGLTYERVIKGKGCADGHELRDDYA